MIHYTLLPEEEIRKLRWEYRVRLFVILLFFLSCVILIGMLSLIPSYVISDNQGTRALRSAEELQKGRQARGIDQIEKELKESQVLVKELRAEKNVVIFSEITQKILSHRPPQLTLSGFDLSSAQAKGTTTITAVIQGRAQNREALISFKENLEHDKQFSGVELPISDLAKSKDISFAMRLLIVK